MGGFTLDDGYVRGVAPTHYTESSFDLPATSASMFKTFFQNIIVLTTKSLVPIPVPVSRVNAYSGGVLARALPEGLRYLST
jgi:hypothetical protein